MYPPPLKVIAVQFEDIFLEWLYILMNSQDPFTANWLSFGETQEDCYFIFEGSLPMEKEGGGSNSVATEF